MPATCKYHATNGALNPHKVMPKHNIQRVFGIHQLVLTGPSLHDLMRRTVCNLLYRQVQYKKLYESVTFHGTFLVQVLAAPGGSHGPNQNGVISYADGITLLTL
jgi:hypothetical protein